MTPAIQINFDTFDADTEYATIDVWSLGLNWLPKVATLIITTDAGTTALIDIDVDVSMDGTTYTTTNINNVSADDTYAHHPNPDFGEPDTTAHTAWRYWKVLVNTVGAGNTLSADLTLTAW